MSGHVLHPGSLAREASPATRRAKVTGWLAAIARAARTLEERRVLGTLDERMLADIGVNRLEAAREASRAPWDLPSRP